MRLRYIVIVAYNLIRLPIKTVLSGFKLSCGYVQLISPKTEIDIHGSGRIVIGKKLHTENNSFLSAGNSGTLSIGENCYLNRNVMIVCRDSVQIESGVTIGPNVVIYDHDHDIKNRGAITTRSVTVGKNVWIGANSVILKGVSIGDNAVIAAGTVVARDVPPGIIIREEKHYFHKSI